MSLLGIDVGSSSVKISAYSEDGKLLVVVNHNITPLHPQPGWWETDPEDVWQAARLGLQELAANEAVRRDPPRALAISASGRENFPADAQGNPLGNNLMGADVRGAEFEVAPPGAPMPEPWMLSCGHLRERMDPVMRLLWWRKYHPEVIEKARTYPDWHSFLVLRLCGRNVSEHSLVGRWAVYDIVSRNWSPERVAEYDIPSYLFPEVMDGGQPVDKIKPELARELALPEDLVIVAGGHDLNCAAVGAGASRLGSLLLISGSYENVLIPTEAYPTASMLLRGLSLTPHLGKVPRSICAVCPTGNAVMNWARGATALSIEELAASLETRGSEPSPVMALPYLSGAMLHWQGGRKLRGALLGITLATSSTDIVQAFMESIAYDHVNTLSLLAEEGIAIDTVRATGGGTRSTWWNQLKSDLMGVQIQVSAEPEPGTLGAALLAGVGIGVFRSVEEAVDACAGSTNVYDPNPSRADQHRERFELYCSTVPQLLTSVFENWV